MLNKKLYSKKLKNKIIKNSPLIILKTRIINLLMLNGIKSISEKNFFKSLKLIQQVSNKDSKKIIKFSLINISPFLYVKQNKRRKRILSEIPFLLKSDLRIFYAIKSIIKIVKIKKESSFHSNFKKELINILKKNSNILKQKEELHKYSFSKKVFSHFRWF